jgi:hypothetical protein
VGLGGVREPSQSQGKVSSMWITGKKGEIWGKLALN